MSPDESHGPPPATSSSASKVGRFWRSWRWWRRAAHVSVAVWIANIVAFAATVVAARGLGVRDYGVFVLAISVAGLVARFLDLTLEEAVVHYGARVLEQGDTSALRRLLRTALWMDLAIGVLVATLIVLSAGPVAAIVDDPAFDPVFIRLAALTTLASTIDGTTGAVLLLSGRTDLRAWSQVATSVFRLILISFAASGGGARAVLIAFATGTLLGASLQAVFSWRAAWRTWTGTPISKEQRPWLKALTVFGVHSSIWTSVTAVSQGVLPLILGRFAGPAAVGAFDVAALPLKGAEVANDGLRLSLFPQQARLAAQGDTATLDRSVRFYTLLGVSIGIPTAILGWFLVPWLIPLMYSSNFAEAVNPTRVMLVTAVAALSMGWAKTLMPAIGRPQVRTKVSLLELSVMVSLLLILASRGAIGAAGAVAVTYVLVAVTWWVIGRRTLHVA